MKLGITDIEPVDSQFSTQHARILFLEAIRENAYEVLENLLEISSKAASIDSIDLDSLKNWAKVYNLDKVYDLNDDWILETAINTIYSWQHLPIYTKNSVEFSVADILRKRENLSNLEEFINGLEINRAEDSTVTFEESSEIAKQLIQVGLRGKINSQPLNWFLPFIRKFDLYDLHYIEPPNGLSVWMADREPRSSYIEWVEKRIHKELQEGFFPNLPFKLKLRLKAIKLEAAEKYCNAVLKEYLKLKDSYKTPLWVETKKKVNLRRNSVWAVKFQVLNQDFSEIARSESIKRPTIQKEIESFLETIKLHKKTTYRGRRKGTKES